jgi:hypothetical protein
MHLPQGVETPCCLLSGGLKPLAAFFLDDGTKTLVMTKKGSSRNKSSWVPTFVGMAVKVAMTVTVRVRMTTLWHSVGVF